MITKLLRKITHFIMEVLRQAKDYRFILHHRRDQHKVIYDPHRDKITNTGILSLEQKKAIDTFYLENYGKKIDHRCHQFYTACADVFDPAYIPDDIYIAEIDHYMSMFSDYIEVFQDKNILPLLAESLNIRVPHTICKSAKDYLTDEFGKPISDTEMYEMINKYDRICIKKSVGSSQGRSVYIIHPHKDEELATLKQVIKEFHSDFVIQEALDCHISLTEIYPKSVNTFRIMTYRWHDQIKYSMSMLRMGRGQMQVDNASMGGLFIGIKDDGSLRPYAITKCGERFYAHPDTGTKFDGYKLELFSLVVETAIRLHQNIPQIGIAHWDFTINKAGIPILIEGNLQFGGAWALQMANGKSVFGDDTAEILRWVREIKKVSPSDRLKNAFGNEEIH